ncbi:TIGR01906 family membrane protein [Enterococcus phoeniculicola]|jgi:integral membrane protein (TIGR01906 family)|uniref:Integral membrane protein n=1 Tax=Enterococcus phoeniculicola ATCC BAA-412 TaxID=1158610 RepID=R3W8I2_9ENTE|nr:TIGR01906 family membrane protein [Enterococcus phoeniculicola]EOL44136.1 integral membrane protein [Enterococcus phoeniculicola ATCC BAA-412]EOT75238.1 integral membrane protein [Enterococcus phoeniculicola ATCC BAA-412]
MNQAKKWRWIERGGILSLFLSVISLAVLITINFRPLYRFDIDYLNILDYTTVTKETLMENFGILMSYLNNPFQSVLAMPDFPSSASGTQHFYEVKLLFLLDYGVFFITLIPSVLFLRYLWKNKRKWLLIRPFQVGMIVPVVFGFIMALGFDRFFVTFHEVFFNNDDWLFDPVTDPIINVLPESFFMHSFILFFILIEGLFFLFYFLGKRELKKT